MLLLLPTPLPSHAVAPVAVVLSWLPLLLICSLSIVAAAAATAAVLSRASSSRCRRRPSPGAVVDVGEAANSYLRYDLFALSEGQNHHMRILPVLFYLDLFQILFQLLF